MNNTLPIHSSKIYCIISKNLDCNPIYYTNNFAIVKNYKDIVNEYYYNKYYYKPIQTITIEYNNYMNIPIIKEY